MKLADLPLRCFQGVVPAAISTCSGDGIPNITYLSQVFRVDDDHVALSYQFFNKTKKNVLENPVAALELTDPQTIDLYRVRVRYQRSENQGSLFDQMSARIDAIASHTGMTGIFKLLASDIYEVVSVEKLAGVLDDPPPGETLDDPPIYRSEIHGLQLVSQRVCRARDLDELLTTSLEALEIAYGFEHAMVLLCDEGGGRLYSVASRGYGGEAVGAEVLIGDGLIGTVARERCVLRVAGVGAELRYGRAIRASVTRSSQGRTLPPEIPLPGLVEAQSQLALPLVAGDRLVGVLAIESPVPGAFEEWHEPYLEIIANQLALGIEMVVKKGRDADALESQDPAKAASAPSLPASAPTGADEAGGLPPGVEKTRARRFTFYRNDDVVFVDDEYLVRNVPGKILWRLLKAFSANGRVDFTNRELRLDPSLGLPAVRDNLESRLVLLRKRLSEKCPDLAIVPTGRGQFRLDVKCALELDEQDSS